MTDLTKWLEEWGLGQLADRLAEHDVDLATLPHLTDEDLREIGLTLGLRRRLLHAIEQGLRQPAADAVSQVGATQGAERRQLTIVFSDLAESTGLTARLDPEEMGIVLRAYQQCCAAAAEQYGGRIARFSGDGVLTYFGYPQAHEDDAERAIRAALVIARDVPRLRPFEDVELGVRIGIATGNVMVGEIIGEGESEQIEVVGDAPNLAARLQAMAPPNGILIGAGTHRLIGGLFDCVSLGTQSLKGYPTELTVWQVRGEGAAEGRFDALHARAASPMIGRDHELGLLADCWQRAVAGTAQVALISGEPGVGKSRLLHALRAELEPSEAYILTLFCSTYHQSSALYPVINHYERTAGIVYDDPPERKLEKLEDLLRQNDADLNATAPLLATLLSIPFAHRYDELKLTPEQLKERTLTLLIGRIRDVARRRPVLCLVEDVHWIDPTSSELLSRMIAALTQSTVFVVLTCRTPADRFATQDGTPLLHVPLTRLDRPHAELLLRHSTGGRAMSREMRDAIIARADGVPLFVEELSKAVLEFGLQDARRGTGTRGPPPEELVPATLHDSLMARLDRMSLVKPVAQLAAVLGRVFTVQLLSAVAPQHWQPIDAAIAALAAAEIILPVHEGAQPAFRFKHALLQDVAYQSLLRTTRRDYHARIARALDEQFADLAETQPEVVARHFSEAGLAEKAVQYWLRAGQRSVRSSANLEALSQFERGRGLLDQIADADERSRLEFRLTLAQLTPLIAVKGYASPENEAAFERAIVLGEALGDTEAIFPALFSRQSFKIVFGRIDQALVHTDELMRLARRHPNSETGAFAPMKLGIVKLFLGEFAAAREEFRQALAVYDAARHHTSAHIVGQDHFATTTSWLTLTSWHLGWIDEAMEYRRRSLEYARSLDHVNTLAFSITFASGCFAGFCRDNDILRQAIAELSELGQQHALPVWTAVGTGLRGKLLIEEGRLDEGIDTLRAGIAALSRMRIVLLQSMFTAWLATALAARGRPEEGFAAIVAWREIGRHAERWVDAELLRARGELLLVSGRDDGDGAERSFREALDVSRSQGTRALELRAATSLARLLHMRRRPREALDVLETGMRWFAGTRDTPDLFEARTLWRELA